MKTLAFLKELKESRAFDGNIEYKLDEVIAEFEGLNSCDGCRFNTQFSQYDMDTGERLEDVLIEVCYMCSRNMNDRYEPKV